MAKRGRPREFDRSAALWRAMEVFWQQGYEGTSLNDLTTVMGINSPSLYAAFGCKEALYREAVALFAKDVAISRAFNQAATARKAFEVLLYHSADAYTDPERPSGCMIVLSAMTCTRENEAIRNYCAGYRQELQKTLRNRLKRGVSEGDVPVGADNAAVAAFYTTVMQGLSIQARDGATRAKLHRIVDCALAAWDTLVQPGHAKISDRSRNS
jgi:AcrR family transcriptional regulator